MTQLSMKAGLKHWKDKVKDAVSKELGQLHWRDTFELVDPKSLTREEFQNVLESHLFLKEKCDGSIKGQMVTSGNKQCGTINKEEAMSPTAALKSVLLTATIDAKEGRDVTVIDVLNAFIQT